MRTLAVFLLALMPAFAQVPVGGVPNGGLLPRYQAFDSETLSSSADWLSVQQVANGPQIQMRWGSVYCASACMVQFYRNASLSGSHPPIQAIYGPPASAVVWLGTPLTPPGTAGAVFQLAAGQTQAFDLTEFVMGSGAGSNTSFSIGVATVSSKVEITVEWTEVF
jgi:hypothetical protein